MVSREERETVIVWTDADEKVTICSNQPKMVAKLVNNPQFEVVDKKVVAGKIVDVDGFLPKWTISILRKKRKGRKDAFVSTKKSKDGKI